jgi:hypothetical protein
MEIQSNTPVASTLLATLRDSSDRLVLRPGRLPRQRKAGAWSDLDLPEAAAEYGRMAGLLSSKVAPSSHSMRVVLEDGRTFELTSTGPSGALCLRPIDLPPPDPAKLSGPLDRLQEILDFQTGLVLAGGPDVETTRTLFHALLGMRLGLADECMVLASSDSTYRHQECGGVLIHPPAGTAMHAVESIGPDGVAFDTTAAPSTSTLGTMASVPFVLAGLLAPEPAALLPRWLSHGCLGDPERAGSRLAGTPVGLVMVQGTGPDDRLRFNCWILTEAEQSMAMRGAVSELALSLEKQGSYQRRMRLHRA